MRLSAIAGRAGVDVPGGMDFDIASVTEDSRRVAAGTVFAAVQGEHADGHAFADQAVAQGAVAVLGQRGGITEWGGVPYLRADHVRRAVGVIAHALAGDPSQAMTVIGVTGTNGKSSTVTVAHHVLNECGFKAACFGTLGYLIGGRSVTAPHTTPFGEDLAELFRQARDADVTHVVMEASSHAIHQERIAGIEFNVAAFTNLSQDHLDYHADMEEYRREKQKLFERVGGAPSFTVVNADDAEARHFIGASPGTCYTYGRQGQVRARNVTMEGRNIHYRIESPWGEVAVTSNLLGAHNVMNTLCVVGICGGLGIDLNDIAAAIATADSVPGRFEAVDTGQPFHVIVDYAHTEDGLRNVLAAAREVGDKRVITVFGCGGDRDRTKRPKMARVAGELSDYCIITSDNPRTEEPQRILDDTEAGMKTLGKVRGRDYEVIADRRTAIRQAIAKASAGDLVMIAGKGHEDYQILGTEKIHFDDREEARAALEAL